MDAVFIIESRYKGKCEDLYDCYAHKTYEGAVKHKNELAEEFLKEHGDKMPVDMFKDENVTEIDYSDIVNDLLTLEIRQEIVGE